MKDVRRAGIQRYRLGNALERTAETWTDALDSVTSMRCGLGQVTSFGISL